MLCFSVFLMKLGTEQVSGFGRSAVIHVHILTSVTPEENKQLFLSLMWKMRTPGLILTNDDGAFLSQRFERNVHYFSFWWDYSL